MSVTHPWVRFARGDWVVSRRGQQGERYQGVEVLDAEGDLGEDPDLGVDRFDECVAPDLLEG